MSPRRNLDWLFLFFFYGLLTACSAESGQAQRAQLPETGTADEVLFQQRCHDCHVPPLPESRPAGAWPAIVQRMQSHRITTGLTPLTAEELRRIQAYLQRNAKDAT
jgi:mono/diheme cytochrome c family protein